jgi:membrane associated rhomboid family serine protease
MVVVRRSQKHSDAELQALVLGARGIDCEIIEDWDGFQVLVSPERFAEAHSELLAFEAENAAEKWEGPPRIRHHTPLEIVLAYWALMLFFFAAARRHFLSIDWLEIGSAQTGLIRAGEVWRCITALFLHVSGPHLLGNLVFGSVFLLLLSQILGWGVATLFVVAAGAGGNLLNALVRPPFHDSIGASTALFGAIGLLAALRQNWKARGQSSQLRFWVPAAGGLMLLVLLGVSGERTDILAHLFGFLAGLCLGIILFLLNSGQQTVRKPQLPAAAAAFSLIGIAWVLAVVAR